MLSKWVNSIIKEVRNLANDESDYEYWAVICSLTGAASLAIAFIYWDAMAMITGAVFCRGGLYLNRRRK